MAAAQARLQSAEDAAFALLLADVEVSSRQLQRIAHEIGGEMTRERDENAELHRRRGLPVRVPLTPDAVAVEVDGGRLRTREPGHGPGVHNKEGKEDKVACLATLDSQTHAEDPSPEPPEKFREPRRVRRLVLQMKGRAGDAPEEGAGEEPPGAEEEAPEGEAPDAASPRKRVRTCVASMADSGSFGPLVAAEAQGRGFFQARRKAFVGDGAAYNWTIQRGWFADFEPIADFLHVLCYLYLAAWAVGGDDEERWSTYLGWMRACWQGRTGEVIGELGAWRARLGEPPEGAEDNDPRRLVKEALTYLTNNEARMDYPRYRKAGLPVTSSLVESLVGQLNARVKGEQKYWNRGTEAGAESILQLRAALLSEDGRLERHFANRPGNPYRRRYNH